MQTWFISYNQEIAMAVKMFLPVLIVLILFKIKPHLPARIKTVIWQLCFISLLLVPVLNQITLIELPWLAETRSISSLTFTVPDLQSNESLISGNDINQDVQINYWLLFYFTIVFLLLVRYIWQSGQLVKLRNQAQAVKNTDILNFLTENSKTLNIRKTPHLLQSHNIDSPMTWGFFKPVILIPATATTLQKTSPALVHELFHIRRNDWIWLQASNLICCFFWFNPLLWFSRYQSLNSLEQACDECVIETGILPSEYAGALMYFHQNTKHSQVAAMAAHTQLYQRLNKVLTTHRRKDMKIWQTLSLIISLNLIFITIGCSRVTAVTKDTQITESSKTTKPVVTPQSKLAPPKPPKADKFPALAAAPVPPLADNQPYLSGVIEKEELQKMTEIQLMHAENALMAAQEQLKNYKMPDLKELEKQIIQSEKMLANSEAYLDSQKDNILKQLDSQMLLYKDNYKNLQLSEKEKQQMIKEFAEAKQQVHKEMAQAKIEMAEAKKQIAKELQNFDMSEIEKQIEMERAEIEKSLIQIRKQRQQLK